jgi:hypothetical protein
LLANSSPQQSAAAAAGVPCDVDWPSVDLYISDKLIFIYIMDIVHMGHILCIPPLTSSCDSKSKIKQRPGLLCCDDCFKTKWVYRSNSRQQKVCVRFWKVALSTSELRIRKNDGSDNLLWTMALLLFFQLRNLSTMKDRHCGLYFNT